MNQQEFIDAIALAAQRYQQQHGIFASITIAQAALETGWGRFLPVDKYTGQESFNLFGVKGGGPAGFVWCDTQEFVGGKMVTEEAQFRKYNNWEESIADHSQILLLERYRPVREATNWRAACMYLQSCGYATDPFYSSKLIRLIEEYHLQKYDILPTPFPDVPLGHWAAELLARLKGAGVVVGDEGTGNVRGDDPPTRYEMFAFGDALLRHIKSLI